MTTDRELRHMMQDIDAQWLGRALFAYMVGVINELRAADVPQYIVESMAPPEGTGVLDGLAFEHHQFPCPGYFVAESSAEELFYDFALFMDAVILRRIGSLALLAWRVAPEIGTTRDFDTYRMLYSIYCRVSVWLKKETTDGQ